MLIASQSRPRVAELCLRRAMKPRGRQQRRLHLVLAFCAGVAVTWACLVLAARLPPGSFARLLKQIEGMPGQPACPQQTAPGVALSPLYLAHASNDSSATTQTLIVAARSSQARCCCWVPWRLLSDTPA